MAVLSMVDKNESTDSILNDIFNYKCDKLDITGKFGFTGYIDFIKKSDVTKNIMKGIDDHGRNFIVVSAEFVDVDEKKTPLFFTFFQRYSDNEKLYHCCGHDGQLLFWTDGGSSPGQIKFLRDLLYNGRVYLNSQIISEMRLTCGDLKYDKKYNQLPEDKIKWPQYVQIQMD